MLTTISRVLLQPNKREITTFKIFQHYKNNFFSICKPYNPIIKSHSYFKFAPIGEWISCYCDYDKIEWPDVELEINNSDQKYPTGFHCYLNLSDAQKIMTTREDYPLSVICKCKSKYRMIFGDQRVYKHSDAIWSKVVVCRGLKIIEML